MSSLINSQSLLLDHYLRLFPVSSSGSVKTVISYIRDGGTSLGRARPRGQAMAQLREAGGANSLVLALVQPKGGLQKTEEIILFLLILQVGISDCFWLDGEQSAEGEQQICLTRNQQQC